MPVDGTFPTATAQWEKRNIALEIPVWDEGALHPVRQVRAGLPACRHPRQGLRLHATWAMRPPASSRTAALEGIESRGTRCRSRRKIAPVALSAWKSARRRARASQAQRHQHGAAAAAARNRSANWDFFLRLPETDREPALPRPGEGRPASGAALRVLRRLLRAAAKRRTSS